MDCAYIERVLCVTPSTANWFWLGCRILPYITVVCFLVAFVFRVVTKRVGREIAASSRYAIILPAICVCIAQMQTLVMPDDWNARPSPSCCQWKGMPSGHALGFSCVAASFALDSCRRWPASITFLLAGVLLSTAAVVTEDHTIWQVVVGWVEGVLVAYCLRNRFKQWSYQTTNFTSSDANSRGLHARAVTT